MPVNRDDHLQRHERHSGEGAQQGAVAEFAPLAVHRGDQQRAFGVGGDDRNERAGRRRRDAKAVGHVHVEERRDMQRLRARLPYRPGSRVGDRYEIGMPLTKRIRDFPKDCPQPAVRAVDEENAERVEDIAEDARQGQQPDRAAVGRQPCRRHVPLDLRTERRARAVAIVAIMKAEEVESVARKQP